MFQGGGSWRASSGRLESEALVLSAVWKTGLVMYGTRRCILQIINFLMGYLKWLIVHLFSYGCSTYISCEWSLAGSCEISNYWLCGCSRPYVARLARIALSATTRAASTGSPRASTSSQPAPTWTATCTPRTASSSARSASRRAGSGPPKSGPTQTSWYVGAGVPAQGLPYNC